MLLASIFHALVIEIVFVENCKLKDVLLNINVEKTSNILSKILDRTNSNSRDRDSQSNRFITSNAYSAPYINSIPYYQSPYVSYDSSSYDENSYIPNSPDRFHNPSDHLLGDSIAYFQQSFQTPNYERRGTYSNGFVSSRPTLVYSHRKEPIRKTEFIFESAVSKPQERTYSFHETNPCLNDYGGSVCPRGTKCTPRPNKDCPSGSCPPLTTCSDPCESGRDPCLNHVCRKGESCYVKTSFRDSICRAEPECRDSCERFDCPAGEFCYVQEETCIKAPCNPGPVCINPCDTVKCARNEKCILVENDDCRGRDRCPPVALCRIIVRS